MEHVLDNPVWHALLSGNKHLANGNDQVKYFDRDVSPFAAMKENSAENFQQLNNITSHNGTILFVTSVEVEIPGPWKVLHCIKALQMIFNAAIQHEMQMQLTPLTDEHVPQMIALTKLTNPGPFEARTIEFGHYQGIFEDDKLVAMAGQRLHVPGHAEISAVCTHPDHLGKGYARQLLIYQINRIKAIGATPFLHVRCSNERAIKVYESLGFSKRREIYFNVLKKADA